MEDKEFKSLKGYIKSRYLYYNQDNEKMIFTQLNSAKKKKNLTYNDIELCLRYIFDCINDKLKPNYLAWGIYNYYNEYYIRINQRKEFCINKYKYEIDEEIRSNSKLTNFDIYIMNIEKEKCNEKETKKENEDIKYKEFIEIIDKINNLIKENNLKINSISCKYYKYPYPEGKDFLFGEYITDIYSAKKKLNKIERYCNNSKNNNIDSKYNIYDFIQRLSNKYGVYMLKSRGKIVYIGKTSDLSIRPLQSIKEREDIENEYYPIDELFVYPTKTKSDMHVLEPYLISKYKPIFNIEFVEEENDKVTIFNCDITEKDFESNGIFE